MTDATAFRICALCRHLEVVGQGHEFEGIADTAYLEFRCKLLGWKSREDYLMAPVSDDLPAVDKGNCPFWEPHERPA
jgi:hypothetical protein